jgi:membrane-bound metal-dependent hydrolase YbcI (DUF457 family)
VQYFDHAMLGATLALAVGPRGRSRWALAVMAAGAAALPDWDCLVRAPAPQGYASVHRVWGHSLLVAPLLSGLVGALGYLCWLSARRPPATDADPQGAFSGPGLAAWVAVGVLAALSHLLADLCYCGVGTDPDWPVALLWPLSLHGWAHPLVVWADRGVTCILGLTLAAACLRPSQAKPLAAAALLVVAGYVALGGAARFVG